MIEIISKSGKRIGKISDSLTEEDMILIDGKEVKLTDAYSSEDIRKKFNEQFEKKTKK
jgi:hypothetical protein